MHSSTSYDFFVAPAEMKTKQDASDIYAQTMII